MSFVDELHNIDKKRREEEAQYLEEKRRAKQGISYLKDAAKLNAQNHKNKVSGYFYWDGYDMRYTFSECEEEAVPKKRPRDSLVVTCMPPDVDPDILKKEIIELINELKIDYEIKLIQPYEYDSVTVRGFFSGKFKSVERNIKKGTGYFIYVSLKW